MLCLAKIFRESCVEKYKELTFPDECKDEAGMNSTNLPWHINMHDVTKTQKPDSGTGPEIKFLARSNFAPRSKILGVDLV